MRTQSMRYLKRVRWYGWMSVLIMLFTIAVPAWGATSYLNQNGICNTSDLADAPLELLNSATKVPAMLMISLDDHSTMDYSVMTTDSSTNNQFTSPTGNVYGYILEGKNANGGTAIETTADSNDWESQCSSYNKMYFNPAVDYEPWPTLSDSDIDNPQWDPQDSSNGTYTLTEDNNGTYVEQDFGAGVPTYAVGSSTTVNQEINGSSWQEVAASATADSNGDIRIEVNADVTSVNTSTSDEFYAGPLEFVDQASGNNAAPTVIIPAPTSISPACSSSTTCDWIQQTITVGGISYTGDLSNVADVTYTAIWDASGKYQLVPGHTYTVYAAWHALDQRSDAIEYDVMTQTGPAIPIIRRHFYVVSAVTNLPYLVELAVDPSKAKFYEIDASKDPNAPADQVTADEMIPLTWANLPSDIQTVVPEPGTTDYTDMLQSFSNWLTYHRKRIYAAQYAIAKLITDSTFTNFLVGMETVPPSTSTGKTGDLWINTEFNGHHYDDTSTFLGILYNLPAPHGNSGFSSDLWDIGKFYQSQGGTIANSGDVDYYTTGNSTINNGADADYVTTGNNGTYPYFTEAFGGSCQQAFALVITDGASPSTKDIKNYDGCYISSNYCGGVFGDAYDDTAADAAMYFYETDLKPDLSNNVPTNYIDDNSAQHMVVFGLSFGVEGPLYETHPDFNATCAVDPPNNTCAPGCNCPTWGDPNAKTDPESVLDDLWHATVNSRGMFLYASDPQELLAQLEQIKENIARRMGSASSVATNSVQRQVGTQIYQGFYDSKTWWGDLEAKSVDVSTGTVGAEVWSARDQLIAENYADRKVFTNIGTSNTSPAPADFDAANAADFGLTADQVNYILGDSEYEEPNGSFRERIYTNSNNVDEHYKLGDIAHSQPFYYDGVVYVGANDGMLHAFDASSGKELFAYVPSMVFGNLAALTDPDYINSHQYYVDASPYVASNNKTGTDAVTYLACGLGKGGKGVFCLTVGSATTDPTASSIVHWEYTAADDADQGNLGYVYGHAYVAQTHDGNTSVIFGNGYLSNKKTAALYIINAATGKPTKIFDTGVTGVTGCNGMAAPALVDYNSDGDVDYVYAGDLNGDLWKFDLTSSDPADWHIAYGGHPLFVARDTFGNVQPITSEPDVMYACGAGTNGVLVTFGTGQYLNVTDLTTNTAEYQAVYGIYDWELDMADDPNVSDPATQYLGQVVTTGSMPNGSASLSNSQIPPVELVEQSVVSTSANNVLVSSNPVNYYYPEKPSAGGSDVGWFFVLPGALERVVQNVTIQNGVVYVVSNTLNPSFCSGSGGGWLYALDACTGGGLTNSVFDTNGDNVVNSSDDITFSNGTTAASNGMYYDSTLFAPFVMQNTLYIVNTFGNIITMNIQANPSQMRYWRIIQ